MQCVKECLEELRLVIRNYLSSKNIKKNPSWNIMIKCIQILIPEKNVSHQCWMFLFVFFSYLFLCAQVSRWLQLTTSFPTFSFQISLLLMHRVLGIILSTLSSFQPLQTSSVLHRSGREAGRVQSRAAQCETALCEKQVERKGNINTTANIPDTSI